MAGAESVTTIRRTGTIMGNEEPNERCRNGDALPAKNIVEKGRIDSP